jgi:hypothetical protein
VGHSIIESAVERRPSTYCCGRWLARGERLKR